MAAATTSAQGTSTQRHGNLLIAARLVFLHMNKHACRVGGPVSAVGVLPLCVLVSLRQTAAGAPAQAGERGQGGSNMSACVSR